MKFIVTLNTITVDRCRAHPDVYYIFGDNLVKRGTKGQATIRSEPNAIGVPTKKAPSMKPGAFFTDDEYENNVAAIEEALKSIPSNVKVFVPVGIGAGLARLPQKAPRTYAYLQKRLGLRD